MTLAGRPAPPAILGPMDAPAEPRRPRNPWWIPPFLGRVPAEISPDQLRLLGVVALALFFENYDLSMLGSALKFIREDFGLAQSEGGRLQAMVRLGALPVLFVIPFVDRLGRRRVFLAALIGMSVGTFATAFAQNASQFVAAQMLSRTFLLTASATAFVIVTEELPAARRGWGIGMLGALGACGFGLGALLFAAIERLPFGWRFLYAVGIVPLLFLPWFRREVHETTRFARERGEGDALAAALRSWVLPIAGLLRRHPWRAAAIAAIGAFTAGGQASGMQLMGDYLQTDQGYSPGQYTRLLILGGMVGIIGNPATGHLADRFGRRAVGFAVLAVFPLAMLFFYRGSGWEIPAAWIPGVFLVSGGNAIVRALSTELFPTASRGTAAGWLMLVETVGAAVALDAVTRLTPEGSSVGAAVSMLVWLTLGAALVVLLLPETAKRELEEISEGGKS
jgi:MFS family permease